MSNTSKKNIINGTLWSIVGRLLNAFLKFFSTPLLLVIYGKDNYGLIGLAMSINVYLQIMELGFNTGNIKFIAQWIAEGKTDKINKLVQSSMVFYGIIGVINLAALFVLAIFCKPIFNFTPGQVDIFRDLLYILGGSSLISWSLSISSHVLRGYERIDIDERMQLYSNILMFIAVIAAVTLKLPISLYFLLHGIAIVAFYPSRVLKCKILNPSIQFKFIWHSHVFREVLRYSIAIFTMGIFQFSAKNLRPIIVGMRADVSDVTDYKILEQITNIVLMFSGSFLGILLPYVTKMSTLGNNKAKEKIAYDGTLYLSILISLLVFGLVSIAKPLLIIYVGKEFEHLSFWLIFWAITMLSNHNYALSSIVLAESNLKPLTRYTIFSTVISLLVAWTLTKQYQVGGAIISLATYSTLQLLFFYVYYVPVVMHLNAWAIFFKSFMIPVLMGLLSLFITKIMNYFVIIDNIYISTTITGLVFTMTYLILTFILVLSPKELIRMIE